MFVLYHIAPPFSIFSCPSGSGRPQHGARSRSVPQGFLFSLLQTRKNLLIFAEKNVYLYIGLSCPERKLPRGFGIIPIETENLKE